MSLLDEIYTPINTEIKNEDIFFVLSKCKCKSTKEGREQFFKMQSFGIKPKKPDNYFLCLMDGKWNFDFLSREYEKMYYEAQEWWGFHLLWQDWQGKRFILFRLCGWIKNIEEKHPYLYREIEIENALFGLG